ncbi:branched-chain amino acid transport system ATP-binding protein [Parafrankia irregularis]|uniref:Branched-chain amino acid transport system ATP-binding protein n=1 Tax=Parafrankia irregularis TaxID=795642 RepID=A0A0S4QMG3_9ACTN|nr:MULTISPECIES: ABC transporter ATP-binding protein [Parafrankia]MBE3202319.1 ABC transporter ATP-binding protein [Parafrankia sp. CH37]CUU56072.1 branched-chain amino acid transport system ATP-binding protein [Parafrankia irregularis]
MPAPETSPALEVLSVLEVDGITVRYGAHVILGGVSLAVPAGRVTGLIGPNGAGKTTLFNVITGLLTPTGGGVRLGGHQLAGLAPHERARLGMARTFQQLELFGQLTVLENVLIAVRMRERWTRSRRRGGRHNAAGTGRPAGARPAGGRAEAAGLIARVGLTAVADERADSLPTGLGRLVELARALAIRPSVLLLDEPASGQDGQETARFAALLRELAADGMAILLVEHDMDLVMDVCEHLYVLDFGELMVAGSPAQVRSDPRVRTAYLGDTGSDQLVREPR